MHQDPPSWGRLFRPFISNSAIIFQSGHKTFTGFFSDTFNLQVTKKQWIPNYNTQIWPLEYVV